MLVGKKGFQEEGTKLPQSYSDLKYKSNVGSATILSFTLYHRIIVMKTAGYSKIANEQLK